MCVHFYGKDEKLMKFYKIIHFIKPGNYGVFYLNN